ncbi:hypothetical protein T484DRAFT_1969218 [Baffinella frigidus]|nr:hypothetical protein T484DRAFT_1969218 [Cryptophyta sp. CCMP2293]
MPGVVVFSSPVSFLRLITCLPSERSRASTHTSCWGEKSPSLVPEILTLITCPRSRASTHARTPQSSRRSSFSVSGRLDEDDPVKQVASLVARVEFVNSV